MGIDVLVIRGYSIRLPDHYQDGLYPEIITVVIPIMSNISGFRTITELISEGNVSRTRKRFGRSLVNKLLSQRELYSNWKTSSIDLCELINRCNLNSKKIKEVVITAMSSYFHSIGRTYNVQDSYIVGEIHVPTSAL